MEIILDKELKLMITASGTLQKCHKEIVERLGFCLLETTEKEFFNIGLRQFKKNKNKKKTKKKNYKKK